MHDRPGSGHLAGTPMASIIVPVYNGAATIGACVASFLAMHVERSRFEIIVVDNGSTDATRDVLQKFGDEVRVLFEPTRGASAARNRGIREALGSVVAFTDADCTVDEDWLATLLESFGDPAIGVVGGMVLSHKPCNRMELFGEMIHDQRAAIEGNELPYVVTGNWASPHAVLLEVGLFDESLRRGQDVDLSWRIHRAGYRLVYQSRARVFHRNERTLWGLMHEGFVHGFHSVRVREKHLARRRSTFGRRLASDMRRLAAKGDRIGSSLWLLFDLAKTFGELLALAGPWKGGDGFPSGVSVMPVPSGSIRVKSE